jgi:hypothetical protein
MQLRALSMAEGLPARFDARVHSVFRRAFNLELEGAGIVPVVAGRHAPAGGIQLGADAPCDFTAITEEGAPAACRGQVVRIGQELAIDLRGAGIHRPRPPSFAWGCRDSATEHAWRIAWNRFEQAPHHLASARLRQGLGRMVLAGQRDPEGLAAAASGLIGLGPGLTPSGDDALVGWLCAFGALGDGDANLRDARDGLAQYVTGAAGRTTAISRHYLRHAARGEVGTHLTALAEAIARGDATRTGAAVSEALAVGATSGADGVLGLLTGLASAHPIPALLLPAGWAGVSAAA